MNLCLIYLTEWVKQWHGYYMHQPQWQAGWTSQSREDLNDLSMRVWAAIHPEDTK